MYFKVNDIRGIGRDLLNGKVGVFPFDTIWGLTATFDFEAVQKIFSIKKREAKKPFIVILPNKEMVYEYAEVDRRSLDLINKYWPGPYTLILRKKKTVPDFITNGLPTIAIRVPEFVPLNYLLDEVNAPLVSTSVNFSGDAPAIEFDHIERRVLEQVDFAYKKVNPIYNKPSKIIDCTAEEQKILRD
jgi:L-threonylcarbamoyladenylate synthase